MQEAGLSLSHVHVTPLCPMEAIPAMKTGNLPSTGGHAGERARASESTSLATLSAPLVQGRSWICTNVFIVAKCRTRENANALDKYVGEVVQDNSTDCSTTGQRVL